MTARVVLLSNTLDQTTDGQHAQPLELDPDSRKLYARFILIDHPVPRWGMLVTIFDVRPLVADRDWHPTAAQPSIRSARGACSSPRTS